MDSPINDRFKLDSLPKPSDAVRPTIPYAQFPRPTLTQLSTSWDHSAWKGASPYSSASERASSTHLHSLEFNMDPGTPSGHRRRRSSVMNSSEGGAYPPKTRSRRSRSRKSSDGTGDQKWSEDDSRGSADGSPTTSEEMELDDFSEEEGVDDDEETGLTARDKKRRRRRRRRNTLLDQRVVPDALITQEEKEEAYKALIKKFAVNGLLIALWYLFSLSISLYNTWMFSKKHLDFKFPLFTTSMHMLVQFTLASTVLYFMPRFRPRYDSISNQDNIQVSEADRLRHEADLKKPLMSRWFYCTRLGPCGMATGLDIGLGNTSLKFISLTFYTMCKSSSLAFVLMFAFLFRLEQPSWRLVAIIATMTVGVIMMVFGEVDFSAIGFILVIAAAFFSGFRWGLTQILLLRNPATSNPFSSIFFLAPIMFVTMIALAVPVEGIPALIEGFHNLVAEKGPIIGPGILLFPGVIAFLMTSSEFALLQRTSVVTLSIAGIFKEVVTIAAAGLVFDEHLTPINISGLFVTIGAIAAYNYIKITKMREDAIQKAHSSHIIAGHSSSDADSEDDEEWDEADDSRDRAGGELLPNQSIPAGAGPEGPLPIAAGE